MINVEDTGKTRIIKQIERNLGNVVLAALAEPKTVEVLLNADGVLWHEKVGERMVKIGTMEPAAAESVINAIAAYYGIVIEKSFPLIEAELPLDGSRFAGQLPPVVTQPTFAIRKKASQVFPLEDYVEKGIMTQGQADTIIEAVQNRQNIIVIGSTGSGKTTLVNGIILEKYRAFPNERTVIIEDTSEIQSPSENYIQYHTTYDVTMTVLLRTTLRMRPDSIIVGEVRGAEALDLLDAWNTGHPGGICTIHANNSTDGLFKLASYVSKNKFAPRNIEPLIGQAVQLLIFITRTPTGRQVTEIVKVLGYENGQYQLLKL